MYIDYGYYRKTYGGSLSEEAFSRAEPKAEAIIRSMTFHNGDIFAKEDERVKTALCAGLDVVGQAQADAASRQSAAGSAGIKSESNDGYSVSYISDVQEGQTAAQALRRRVAQEVRDYLLPTGWLRLKISCGCGHRGCCL